MTVTDWQMTIILLYPDMHYLRKQCRSKSEEANWSWSILFVIEYANLYQQPRSNNLIGWQLEVGGLLFYSAWLGLKASLMVTDSDRGTIAINRQFDKENTCHHHFGILLVTLFDFFFFFLNNQHNFCQFIFMPQWWKCWLQAWFLFVLRFYGPVNPMWSCRAWSVYLTTRLLGRLSPLSG